MKSIYTAICFILMGFISYILLKSPVIDNKTVLIWVILSMILHLIPHTHDTVIYMEEEE
jgi:hypothetical protein